MLSRSLPMDSSLQAEVQTPHYEPPAGLTAPRKHRRHALVVPREHGAWGMLLAPLVTGAAVGLPVGGRIAQVLLLATTVLALFWLRTPVESWLGTGVVHAQSQDERRLVRRVILSLAALAALTLSALLWHGKNLQLLWIGAIAGVAFIAQLGLRKMGRATRMAAQIVGSVALTSTAPAAYYVATGKVDAACGALWLTNWLFASDQVHFVWLRIRGAHAVDLKARIATGWSFLAGNLVLIGALSLASYLRLVPALALIAFAPIVLRGLAWFARKPGPLVVRQLGFSELAHALVFCALLIAAFRLAP